MRLGNCLLLAACLTLLVALFSGCNSEDAHNLGQDTRNIATDLGHATGNAQLAGRVNAELTQRKGVDMSGLHIEAKDGVVTVGGHVRNTEEKQRVIETVNGIRGVDKVVNQLRVQP